MTNFNQTLQPLKATVWTTKIGKDEEWNGEKCGFFFFMSVAVQRIYDLFQVDSCIYLTI